MRPVTSPQVMVTVCRNELGTCDDSLKFSFAKIGMITQNICDEEFVFPKWSSTGLRYVRRILRPLLVREMSTTFLEQVKLYRPQNVFIFKGHSLHPDSVREARKYCKSICLYFPDISPYAHGPFLAETMKHVDLILSSKTFLVDGFKGVYHGVKMEFMPLWYDERFHYPMKLKKEESETLANDILFIGNHSQGKESTLNRICNEFPDLTIRIWGHGWKKTGNKNFDKALQFKPLFGPNYAKAITNSKITLGLLQENQKMGFSDDLITSRTFQIPACGGFMIHKESKDLRLYFNHSEVPGFADDKDLLEKINYFLNNEKEVINSRMAAYNRVCIGGHSSADRARKVLERMAIYGR